MTKISIYQIDEYVTADDKWIGTDVNTYNKTKNFTPRKLSNYFNSGQVINTGVDLLYKYFTITPPETRPTGTLSFETEIGPTVNFSAISTFLLSNTTLKGNYIVEFFDFLVGTNVLLYKAKNINLFGSYKINSVEEYLEDPNFFVVNVEFIEGNGFIEEDEDYMISLIDISSGSQDLQEVTDIGSSTTNSITANSFIKIGGTGTNILLDDGNTVALSSIGGNTNLSTSQTSTNFTINSDTGDDAIVPLGDGDLAGATLNNYTTAEKNKLAAITGTNTGDQDLQSVTTLGATTTKGITITVGDGGGDGIHSFSSQGYGVYGSSSETFGVYGSSPSSAGVYGIGATGVYGESTNGNGVEGVSVDGNAIYGSSANVIGVYARSDYGTGLYGYTEDGVAIFVQSNAIGLEVNGNGTIAIQANLGNSNKGIVINSGTSSTGNFIELNKNGVEKLTINQQGELSIVKIPGGTNAQILAADGSVITAGTNITISGGTISSSGGGGSSPLTTKGDLYTFSTVDARLPIGTDGQILTANSGVPEGLSWQDNYADWTSTVKHIVKNNGLSGTITKGTAVYVTSSNGTNMLVGRASNVSEQTSSKTMGLMQSDITTTGGTQTGFVITEGLLGGLNTAGATAGDPVWLGVDGALIYGLINKPYAPNHLVFIGIVTKVSAGNGEIFVKVQNGFELKELHDVQAQSPTLKDTLYYDNTVSPAQWKTSSISSILGYTPANDSNVVHIAGTEIITGAKTFSSQTILGDGVVGATQYGLTPQATVGSTSGGVFDIRNTNTNIVAGNTVGTLQFSAKDDDSVAYLTAQIKAITQNGIGTGSSGKTDLIFYTSNGSSSIERVKMNDLGLVINSEVTSTIASFDSNKSIKSLTTADGYPSLVELKWLAGTTSSIQTQLNYDASATQRGAVTTGTQTFAGVKTFSSNPKIPLNFGNSGVGGIVIDNGAGQIEVGSNYYFPNQTELSYVKGVTSAIQTQLNGKQPINANLTSISSLSTTAGASFVKVDNGAYFLDSVSGSPQSAYTMLANNTASSAVPTEQTFKNIAEQAYTGSIAWGGTSPVAPSGTTNHSYQWSQIGKSVNLRVNLDYATAGSNLTNVTFGLPSDCPPPKLPSGVSAVGDVICYGSGMLTTTRASVGTPTATGTSLRIKGTGTYEINVIRTTATSHKYAYVTIQYFV